MIPANCIRGTGKMPFAREVFVGDNYAPDDSGNYALALNSTGAMLPDGVVVCEAAINKPESAGEVIALEFFNSSTSDVVVPAETAAAVLVKAPTMMYRQDDPDIEKAELLGNIVTSAVSEISVSWMSLWRTRQWTRHTSKPRTKKLKIRTT